LKGNSLPISERTNFTVHPDGNGYNLHDGGNVPPAQKGKTWKKSGVPRKKKGAKRTYLPEVRERIRERTKGKTLEEINGEERALEMKDKLRQAKKTSTYVATTRTPGKPKCSETSSRILL
jgi:hypothetical protein